MKKKQKFINIKNISLIGIFLILTFLITKIYPQGSKIIEKERKELYLDLLSDTLESPIAMSTINGSDDIYIVEQKGIVKLLSEGSIKQEYFLDLTKKISGLNRFYSEKGLLGLAFHPRYSENRKLYVNYSAVSDKAGIDHKTVISEFQTSFAFPDRVNLKTERVILEIDQPESNHNGGTLQFGPDGYLYIGSGDGGGAGDRHGLTGNAQSLYTHLGKLLRIDVNSENTPYIVPPDNPFLNGNGLPEIFAYGLRNPWKFSIDKVSGKIFLGDVGQERVEEINIIEKGKNYGWRVVEGNLCFDPPEKCNTDLFQSPIYTYNHDTGICVIGGYVYRGSRKSFFYGKYIFGDWSGKIFFLSESNSIWRGEELKIRNRDAYPWKFINSFGEDTVGNLYILAQEKPSPGSRGYLFRIIL